MITEKKCPKCDTVKSASEFWSDAKRSGGLRTYCKECELRSPGTRKALYARRAELAKQGLRDCSRCKEVKPMTEFNKGPCHDGLSSRCKQCLKEARGLRRSEIRNYNLLRLYNITLEQYNAMLAEQNGVCPGCLRTPAEVGKTFAVDHNHACCPGERSCGACVRGLLCEGCNLSVGRLRDDAATLRRLAEYVEAA